MTPAEWFLAISIVLIISVAFLVTLDLRRDRR
jgi:hypothetical protein